MSVILKANKIEMYSILWIIFMRKCRTKCYISILPLSASGPVANQVDWSVYKSNNCRSIVPKNILFEGVFWYLTSLINPKPLAPFTKHSLISPYGLKSSLNSSSVQSGVMFPTNNLHLPVNFFCSLGPSWTWMKSWSLLNPPPYCWPWFWPPK